MSERLEFQLKYRVSASRFREDERHAAVQLARQTFLETGESIPGVEIVARWRNPDNKNPQHRAWKLTTDPGQSLREFWQTLHGGKTGRGALHALADRDIPTAELPPDPGMLATAERRSIALRAYHARVREIRRLTKRGTVRKRPISYADARRLYRRWQ